MVKVAVRSARVSLALLILLGAVWGGSFVAIRYLDELGASPFFLVLLRLLASALLMAIVALGVQEKLPSVRDLLVSAALGGALVIGGYQVLLFWGEQNVPAGLAGVLVASAALFTVALSAVVLPHETIRRRGLLGLLLGFGGVALLFEPQVGQGGTGSVWGLLAVLSASLAFAVGTVLLRKWRSGGEGFWGASVEFAAGALFALPFVLIFEPHPYIPEGTYALVAIAFLVVAVSVWGSRSTFLYTRTLGRRGRTSSS